MINVTEDTGMVFLPNTDETILWILAIYLDCVKEVSLF